MLVPLHVKSAYSFGGGTATVERLVERASALGIEAMALTDTENLYGAIVFQRLARSRGIHPIVGAEISLGQAERLVLLARDRSGYENLCRIITRRKLDGAADPLGSLLELRGGLFVLTDRAETLERLLAIGLEPAALRLLLVRPSAPPLGGESAERALLEASRRRGVPLVADADIVYLDPADHPLHRLRAAIEENLSVDALRPPLDRGPGRHFPAPREWEERFADLPEALAEAERIAAECRVDLRRTRWIFPRLDLPPGEPPASVLARRCLDGLARRSPRLAPGTLERLGRELAVIDRLGFSEYFLAVGDIVGRARERGIEVVGRGSGAASLVTYLLGVTNVDPVAYELCFERFLHDQRTDLPDIDIDLCWIRRDEVIADVYRTHGDDRVAMISSHITFQPRSAFREAARAFGAPPSDVDRYSGRIPHLEGASIEAAIRGTPLAREIPIGEEPYRTALPLAERLVGLPHHLSIHPGGIVIGDRPLDAYVPLERASKGVVVTQYDMYSIEEVGLVKIDLLGNRCLSEIQETLESARRAGTAAVERLADIPDRDPAAAALLREGDTVGCFQLESPAMRSLLRQLRASSVRDCIAAVALIRPGPSVGGMKDRYVRRAAGEEEAEYLLPQLREVLAESHGLLLFEEDVMRVAAAVAGVSLAEGDVLRSRLKKCSAPEELRELENGFLSRAISRGAPPDAAIAVWKDLVRFSRYSFNKGHAAGYGLLAYQAAYLKARHPVEFAAALLNHHAGLYSTRTIAAEAQRRGVTLLSPCINRSGRRHLVEEAEGIGRAVRLALGQVRGLAESSIAALLAARPFRSLGDLVRRTRASAAEIEALVLAGGLDFTGLNHPQLLWELEVSRARSGAGARGEMGPDLLEAAGEFPRGAPHPPLRGYSILTRARNEMRILGLSLAAHPMALLRPRARERGCVTIADARRAASAAGGARGARIKVAGLVAVSRRTPARSGELMQFITLEDESGLLEATLFPRVYRRLGDRIATIGPYVVEGDLEERHRAQSLNVTGLERLADEFVEG